jgi:SAM-dependent methyltransferase
VGHRPDQAHLLGLAPPLGLSYVVRNVCKNAAAPILLPLARGRGSLGMDGDFEAVGRVFEDVRQAIEQMDFALAGRDVLELGPGRTAELSMALALSGAATVTGLDTRVQVPAGWDEPERWQSLATALGRDGTAANPGAVSFRVYDGRSIPAADASVDLIVSKSVLEHVDADAVNPLVADMWRALRPGGAMVHYIDLRDHMWIDGDEVRGDWLDALRYSEPLFKAMFSRRSTSINRLRSSEWRRLFEETGFAVRLWDERRYELPSGFDSAELAPRWRGLPEAELAVGQLRVGLEKP